MSLLNTTEFIIGGTGTGKSYLASVFMKESYDKKERLIYTNVNLRDGFNDYIKDFDKDDLYEFAKAELELYKKFQQLSKEQRDIKCKDEDIYILSDTKDDIKIVIHESKQDEIINNNDDISKYGGNYDNYLKDSGLLDKFGNSMIVWDECQEDLQLDGKAYFDMVWGRFFSYRRHFGIHLIMITQDLDLIHRKYKKYGDKFYFGQNASRRFYSKMLRFEVYFKPQEFKKYHIEKLNILMKKDVHNFYDSGSYEVGKSALLKLLLIPIILIISLFFGYKVFNNRYENENINTVLLENNETIVNEKLQVSQDDTEKYKRDNSDHLVFFNCNLENCTIKNSSFSVPLKKMQLFADAVDMEILYSSKINNFYSLVVVSVNESLYNDLMSYSLEKRGDTHDKGKMDFTAPTVFKN